MPFVYKPLEDVDTVDQIYTRIHCRQDNQGYLPWNEARRCYSCKHRHRNAEFEKQGAKSAAANSDDQQPVEIEYYKTYIRCRQRQKLCSKRRKLEVKEMESHIATTEVPKSIHWLDALEEVRKL